MSKSAEIVLDYKEAAALVSAKAGLLQTPGNCETVLIEHALGRCLAVDIRADRDQPPFDRSTRDGYAVRAADLSTASELMVVGQLRAGQPALSRSLLPGEAIEIMTGAPIPPGADAVLMVEHATSTGDAIHARRSLSPGANIVPAGAEACAGSIIIPAGTRLTPMHMGAAVSSGASTVEVYAQPRVSILATGDELVEPDEPLLDHQTRNSNSYSLEAQVSRAGAIPVRLPIAHDNLDDLQASVQRATESDLILLSGGVSMGKFDFVEQVLQSLSAEFFFTGVRIQPGRPLVFGLLPAGKNFFGLPGNPVSTMVTFALFAAPFIRALGGERDAAPLFARAHLTESFQHKPGLTRFLPAFLKTAWDKADVTPIAWQGSGDLAATARANCFVVIPPDKKDIPTGDEVSVLLAY